VLEPSIDMRNRYDTFGVDPNNASIVLQITFGRSKIILTGDAEFDSWGKICEEFPRTRRLTYPNPADLGPMAGQLVQQNPKITTLLSESRPLKCTLLKVAHHGSKNGTSYETLKKLAPKKMVITCDDDDWYTQRKSSWVGDFPHPVTRLIFGEYLNRNYPANPFRIRLPTPRGF